MKFCIHLLFVLLISSPGSFAQKSGSNTDEDEDATTIKCNCGSRQFQQRYSDIFSESKYLTEYLLDFKVDSAGDNKDYVYTLMKERLSVMLAKKIRSKVTSVETHSYSEKSVNNSGLTSQDDFSTQSKSESNVDLSGTGYRFCPDKKEDKTYNGVIFIKKSDFLATQLSLYKIGLKELETQVNHLSKNAMDYSMKELSKELANCNRKKEKLDQIIIVYSSVSTNNEILSDPEIQKINDNIIPKLATVRKRVYNRDVEKKLDSAKAYLADKKFPETMAILDQILNNNPDHDQAKDMQKQCVKTWTEEANYKIDEYLRNNDFEGAIAFINKTISYKVAVVQMNEKLNTVSVSLFNDYAAKIQSKVDAKDVANAKKLLKKLQPYAQINQPKFDELGKAVKKLDW